MSASYAVKPNIPSVPVIPASTPAVSQVNIGKAKYVFKLKVNLGMVNNSHIFYLYSLIHCTLYPLVHLYLQCTLVDFQVRSKLTLQYKSVRCRSKVAL